MQVVQAQLPNWLAALNNQQSVQKQHTEKFFTEWPELNKPEHMPAIARNLAAWRQANPTATPEDVIREGGIATLISLRLPIPERILARNNAGHVDASKPKPASSVTGGSGTAPAPAAKSDNPFTIIAQEDLAEGA